MTPERPRRLDTVDGGERPAPRLRRIAPVLVGVGSVLALGCAGPAPAPPPAARPSVLLVSIDTLRADHVGAYGYPRDTTPFLDRLAAEGTTFDRAYTVAGWTLPSHASLFTGLYPEEHGVWHDSVALPDGAVTLAERLRSAGYATAGVVSCAWLAPRYGLHQGFDHHLTLDPREPGGRGSSAQEVTDAALEWLGRDRPDGPFFLFVHYFDPHADYAPPPEYAERFVDPSYRGPATGRLAWLAGYIPWLTANQGRYEPMPAADRQHVVDLYDGEIRYVDDQLARLWRGIETLGAAEDTLVVVAADHGEEMDDHGSMEGHGWTLYEEIVRVPLLLRRPGVLPAGRRVDEVVELVDVAPTILEAVGIPPGAGPSGGSLWPRLVDPTAAPATDALAFAENRRVFAKASVIDGRSKLVLTAPQRPNALFVPDPEGHELYDLAGDPGERHDLADERPAEAARLRDLLDDWLRTTTERSRGQPAPIRIELNERELEKLRSLGYAR